MERDKSVSVWYFSECVEQNLRMFNSTISIETIKTLFTFFINHRNLFQQEANFVSSRSVLDTIQNLELQWVTCIQPNLSVVRMNLNIFVPHNIAARKWFQSRFDPSCSSISVQCEALFNVIKTDRHTQLLCLSRYNHTIRMLQTKLGIHKKLSNVYIYIMRDP